jgi:hypothetical protein
LLLVDELVSLAIDFPPYQMSGGLRFRISRQIDKYDAGPWVTLMPRLFTSSGGWAGLAEIAAAWR